MPLFTQTFLKQYCDGKSWKRPGGQGRLDRGQCVPERGRRRARQRGTVPFTSDNRVACREEVYKQGLVLMGSSSWGVTRWDSRTFPWNILSFCPKLAREQSPSPLSSLPQCLPTLWTMNCYLSRISSRNDISLDLS